MSDLISRQEAIDAILTWDKFGCDERCRLVPWSEGLVPYVHLKDVVHAIASLPSVQTDMSGYSDRLWKLAYERGKLDAYTEMEGAEDDPEES